MIDKDARVRRWSSKTRTGCRTCRVRRIKCDETRPHCNKCLNAARQCEGYEVPQGNPSKLNPQVLLPRTATVPETGPKYLSPYRFSQNLDGAERRSFDFFRSHVATSLSGHFSSTVFQYLVLQVTHMQPAVLQAAVAVGSMYRARLMAAQLTFAKIHDCPYYGSALKQYNRAISSLSHLIDTQTGKDQVENLIVILITCLLFVCFEMLHGDQAVVLSHLVNGLKLLFERTTPRDSICTNKRILTIGRSDSDTIDTVSQVFVRLDADSTMFGRRAPYLCPRSYGRFLGPELDLPSAFTSLEEARAHLDTLTSITFGFRGELLKSVESKIPVSKSEQMDWPRHYCMLHAAIRYLDLEANPELAGKKDKILAAFESWSNSLSKLDQSSRRQGLLMLKIQKFYPWFIMATLQDIQASLCDRYQNEFENILNMVLEYVNLNRFECPGFTFALEPGMTASLYLVGIKCRDPSIRRRTIEILGKMAVQEGLWSRRLFGTYCQRFMDLEERRAKQILGIGDLVKHIPEEARFNDVVFGMDSAAPGTGRLICARYSLENAGGLEMFEDRFAIDM